MKRNLGSSEATKAHFRQFNVIIPAQETILAIDRVTDQMSTWICNSEHRNKWQSPKTSGRKDYWKIKVILKV